MSSTFHSEVLHVFNKYTEGGWFLDDYEFVFRFQKKTLDQSAVLCCLGKRHDGQICVLLTKRSTKVSTHIGEVCFPGGKAEQCDLSLVETALREAEEEVDLARHQVDVVGTLPYAIVGHRHYLCTVVLCTLKEEIDQLNLKSNSEVETIFWTPLDLFLNGGSDHWTENVQYNQLKLTIDFFRYKPDSAGHIIWGMTSRYCMLVAMLVLRQCTHFPMSIWGISQVNSDHVKLTYLHLPHTCKAKL